MEETHPISSNPPNPIDNKQPDIKKPTTVPRKFLILFIVILGSIPVLIIVYKFFILSQFFVRYRQDQDLSQKRDVYDLIRQKLNAIHSVSDPATPGRDCFMDGKKTYDNAWLEACTSVKKEANCQFFDLPLTDLEDMNRGLKDTLNRCVPLVK